MRILRLISSMNPSAGGPCQGIRNLLPELEKRSVEQEVVSLDDPGADFIKEDNFRIHALGPSKSSWAYSSRLKPWLEANLSQYDAVIQHGLWQYPGYVLLRARRKLYGSGEKVPPLYIYPHGMLDPWFQTAPSRRLKAIRNWIYWKLIENRVIASADGLLFTCEEEMRLAATTFRPYKPKTVYNVGYGIPEPPTNLEEQQKAFASRFPELSGKPFLLFMSRIHPKKGVDLLLRAYAALRIEGQELPPLVIAGPCGDESYWNSLQALACELKLQEKPVKYNSGQEQSHTTYDLGPTTLYWPGMLQNDRKWGTLRAASAFILPSHQENFGIAVVEALACGTPVLISNKVNIWREIEQTGAGRVEADTLEGTKKLISKFLSRDNPSVSPQRPYECFLKNFEIKAAAEKLYNQLQSN